MNITEQLEKAAKHQNDALVQAIILFGKADYLTEEDREVLSWVIDDMDAALKLLNGTSLGV